MYLNLYAVIKLQDSQFSIIIGGMDGRFWRLWIRRSLRTLVASGFLFGLLLLIIAVCIHQQAQRTAAVNRFNGPVEALLVPGLVLSSEPPLPQQQARLDEALRLYRLGYARRILVAEAPNHQGALAYLLKTAPQIDASVFGTVEVPSDTLYPFFQAVYTQYQVSASTNGAYYLVADPYSMLRALKMSQDIGLSTYAAPVKANAPVGRGAEWSLLTDEAWRYFRYITLNRP